MNERSGGPTILLMNPSGNKINKWCAASELEDNSVSIWEKFAQYSKFYRITCYFDVIFNSFLSVFLMKPSN